MNAQFLTINGRRLFCTRTSAVGCARYRVLIAPPFAEELNKCRRLLALTAQLLAAAECDVLLPDLYGTGDSAGDFGEADWGEWAADWRALAAWHAALLPAATPVVLAVRTGALLLAAAGLPTLAGTRVVLWQPVLDGARFLQQFLRVRVMAQRIAGGSETLAQLEQQLDRDGRLEIAGYTLTPALTIGLAATRVNAEPLALAPRVDLFEFKSGALALTAPAEQLCAALRERGCAANAHCISTEQFWATQEITAPDAVATATVALFASL